MLTDWENYYLLVGMAAGSTTGFLSDHASMEEVIEFATRIHGKVKTMYHVQILTEEAFEILEPTFRARESFIEGAN